MFFKVALRLLRRFDAAFFLRRTFGGSKCWRRRVSDTMPSCCTRFVKRRRKPSKLSPSLIRISKGRTPVVLFDIRQAIITDVAIYPTSFTVNHTQRRAERSIGRCAR